MKKICFLLSLILLLTPMISCQSDVPDSDENENTENISDGGDAPEQEDTPHPLNYHEIMSLRTISPGGLDLAYSDIGEYFERLVENEQPFACVEAKCLDVTYYLKWDAERKSLGAYTKYRLQITRVGATYDFPYDRGGIINVNSRITVYPDFGEIIGQAQRRDEFIKNVLGGTEDPETGEVVLESGVYEFVPMSDMALRLSVPDYDNIPMGKGEIYTTAVIKSDLEGWYCTHSYPASKDSIVFTNNFYNMKYTFEHNMHIVAYLATKKVDFADVVKAEAK